MKSPQTQIRLRVSGHLLLGVIKLFYRKALLILSEIEAMVIDIDNNKEQAKAASTKAASAEINMSAKKPKPLTYFENSLSASSLLQSARSSVEIARNRASKEEITLKEINYTPRSLRYSTELKSKEGLDIADNFLDDVASSMRFEEDMQLESYVLGPEMDLEMSDFVMPQPLIDKEKDSTDKISLATPKIAIKRAKKKSEKVEKHKSMKRLWIDDKETIMTQEYENLQQSVNEILRAHQI